MFPERMSAPAQHTFRPRRPERRKAEGPPLNLPSATAGRPAITACFCSFSSELRLLFFRPRNLVLFGLVAVAVLSPAPPASDAEFGLPGPKICDQPRRCRPSTPACDALA